MSNKHTPATKSFEELATKVIHYFKNNETSVGIDLETHARNALGKLERETYPLPVLRAALKRLAAG
jgi:hypothetical protein